MPLPPMSSHPPNETERLALAAQPEQLPTKLTLLLVSTLTVMAGATIAPSLPDMAAHFQDIPNAGMVVRLALTLPALFIAMGAPFVGVMIDRIGRKPLLLGALLLYGLAGGSGLVLNSLGHILIGRAFLGVSVAGIMTTATTLVGDYYRGPARAQFMGLQAGFMGLGGVLFLTIGGFLAQQSWRYPFAIYLLALLLVPCVWVWLPEPDRSPQSGPAGEGQPDRPFPALLIGMTYGIAMITQVVFYLIPTQLPFYLKDLFQADAAQAGVAIACCTLFSAGASLSYRWIKAKLSFVAIYGIAFLNLGLGYGLISLGSWQWAVWLGLAIAGSGLGLLMPNMNLCLTSVSPEAVRGRVLSGITTSFFLGQFLSPLISQSLLSQSLVKTIGLGQIYAGAGALMVVMAVGAAVTLTQWKD